MTTLDDFYGDGSTDNSPECSFCGRADGSKLIVSVQDHSGTTHWHHEVCKQTDDARKGTPLTPTWDETMEINFQYVYSATPAPNSDS